MGAAVHKPAAAAAARHMAAASHAARPTAGSQPCLAQRPCPMASATPAADRRPRPRAGERLAMGTWNRHRGLRDAMVKMSQARAVQTGTRRRPITDDTHLQTPAATLEDRQTARREVARPPSLHTFRATPRWPPHTTGQGACRDLRRRSRLTKQSAPGARRSVRKHSLVVPPATTCSPECTRPAPLHSC
jgi:hypothetical protein